MTHFTVPCDRCGTFKALSETRIRTAAGRSTLALCSDCIEWYRVRHQVVGANLAPIGAQTAPLLGPKPSAQPTPMPRIPTPPALLPPEVRRVVEKETER